jgi:hypothetical protein
VSIPPKAGVFKKKKQQIYHQYSPVHFKFYSFSNLIFFSVYKLFNVKNIFFKKNYFNIFISKCNLYHIFKILIL